MKTLHLLRRMCLCVAGIALIGCGSNGVGPSAVRSEAEDAPLEVSQNQVGAVSAQQMVVVATLTRNGAPVGGIKVVLTRLGEDPARDPNPTWTERTGPDGLVEFDIINSSRLPILSGNYLLQAMDHTDSVVAKWDRIPIYGGRVLTLSLPVDGFARIISEASLSARSQMPGK